MTIKRYRQLITITSVFVVISATLAILTGLSVYSRQTEVIFLDIGQGDAILIKTRHQQNILIDGGPDNRVLDRLGRNLAFFDKKIDLLIATHPDKDHVGGLSAVLERFTVARILDPGIIHQSDVYQSFLNQARARNIPIQLVDSRLAIDFGDNLFLDILYPDTSLVGRDLPDNNEGSIVAKLTDQEIDFLLTADASGKNEVELMAKYGQYLKSEVLKAGHHGSNTSSSQEFIELVSPAVAVIQSGEGNRYGHPHYRVLKRFSSLGIPVFRNDERGDIKMVSDGDYVSIVD